MAEPAGLIRSKSSMLSKLLSAIGARQETPDWESMLTQVDDSGAVSRPGDSAGEPNAHLTNHPDVILALMGLSGEESTRRGQRLARMLSTLAAKPEVSISDWNMVIREATAMAEMGRTLHTLAEIKRAKVQPKAEAFPLVPLVGAVLSKRANHLRRNGVILVPELKPATVIADSELTRAMIETAVDWATPFGNRLAVTSSASIWGSVGTIEIKADDVVRSASDAPKEINRSSMFLWELLVELSQAAGVRVKRFMNTDSSVLHMDFPLKDDGGGLAGENDISVNTLGGTGAHAAAIDIVVFTESRPARGGVDRVLMRGGYKPRVVNSAESLERECELIPPQALIIEEALINRNVKHVIDDLRRFSRNTAVVVLVAEPNVYDMSGPGGGHCRLSVASVDAQLQQALTFELAQI
jgi:hypothetical protein